MVCASAIMKERRFYKNVPNATIFLFDLGMESGMETPQYIIIAFENNNVNEQTHDASTFDIMNVTECYCKIGSEFYPEDRMNINYGTKNYNEAFKEIVSFNKDYNELRHNIKQYISLIDIVIVKHVRGPIALNYFLHVLTKPLA